MKKSRFLFLIWITIGFAVASFAANKKFTLVIDAGHGGHDAGALGTYSKEKNINLNVALAFGRYVQNNCPDVKVIYTRKTDVGMHRAGSNLEVAKRENSVILIGKDYKQHYEGFDPNSSESYIMFEFMQDKNMAQSVELAKFVQKRVCASADRQDKGVKQAGFLVLRETSMPSCLIELGFITTSDEEQFLNSTLPIPLSAILFSAALSADSFSSMATIFEPGKVPARKPVINPVAQFSSRIVWPKYSLCEAT